MRESKGPLTQVDFGKIRQLRQSYNHGGFDKSMRQSTSSLHNRDLEQELPTKKPLYKRTLPRDLSHRLLKPYERILLQSTKNKNVTSDRYTRDNLRQSKSLKTNKQLRLRGVVVGSMSKSDNLDSHEYE